MSLPICFSALVQTLGEGYAIHKQDIFTRKQFEADDDSPKEFLSESYFRYFTGRTYTDSECYLVITQEAKKNGLFSLRSKEVARFRSRFVRYKTNCEMVALKPSSWIKSRPMNMLTATAMNFTDKTISMSNFKVDDECIEMGDKRCKSI